MEGNFIVHWNLEVGQSESSIELIFTDTQYLRVLEENHWKPWILVESHGDLKVHSALVDQIPKSKHIKFILVLHWQNHNFILAQHHELLHIFYFDLGELLGLVVNVLDSGVFILDDECIIVSEFHSSKRREFYFGGKKAVKRLTCGLEGHELCAFDHKIVSLIVVII